MKMSDRIYGEIEIENEIILKLIETKPFQRLKKINQYGGVNFVYKEAYQTSRYEHSIGVWYATYKLGGDLETQVAALLHDVGHFAFSHLVDMVESESSENQHEFSQTDLEGWDEIEKILNATNIKLNNVDSYRLIKNDLPDIGTDRLDYAIWDLECVIPAGDNFGSIVLNNVEVFNGEIIFTSPEVAKEFSDRGNKAMWQVIYDPQIAVVYQSVINILKDGLNDGWITKHNLLGTDNDLFKLFQQRLDQYDSKYFRVFNERYNTVIVGDNEKYDFRHIKLKARYFDPRVKINNELKRISEINEESRKTLEKYRELFERSKTGVNIRLIY